jgi:hypothetical protein
MAQMPICLCIGKYSEDFDRRNMLSDADNALLSESDNSVKLHSALPATGGFPALCYRLTR